jgi:hypothetical protein
MALFALDAFDGGPLLEVLLNVGVHLIPAAIVLLVVMIAWRYPWAGAIGFGALAIGYGAMVPDRLDWILSIGGPLALVAVLFAINAATARNQRSGRSRPVSPGTTG